MKRVGPIIFFIFFISLIFSGEEDKYTFIYLNSDDRDVRYVGDKWGQRVTLETSFTIPAIGFIKYSSQHTETLEFLGVEGKFWKYRATLTEIESDNYVNNIEIMDHYREAMEDNPCYIYVKSSGDDTPYYVEPIKEEDAYLQEAFEAAYMNITPHNFKYPFGLGAVDVSVGDTWTTGYDSSKFYVNMGSPPSLASSRGTWTLKKVREKRGRKIATIISQELFTLNLRLAVEFLGERRLVVGQATGITDVTWKWDVDSGKILKAFGVQNYEGDFKMDDESFHMKIFIRDVGKCLSPDCKNK